MGKKHKPEMVDATNPQWSPADFDRARPASEVLPGLFGKAQSKEMLKPKRGRPKADVTKEHVNLRLDAAVLETFKASGPGWQTRMNAALADWLKTHTPDELKV